MFTRLGFSSRHGDIITPPATPSVVYEDLTTYTSVDPEANYTITATRITVANMYPRHTNSYLYKDFGAGYFTKDLQINFEFCVTDDTHTDATSMLGLIAICNTLGNRDANDAGPFTHWELGTHGVGNINIPAGDDSYALSYFEFPDNGTKIFYCTLQRISALAPADCEVRMSVFSDAARTTLMNRFGGAASIPYGRPDIPSATGLLTFRYLEIALSDRTATSAVPFGSYYVQNVQIVSH